MNIEKEDNFQPNPDDYYHASQIIIKIVLFPVIVVIMICLLRSFCNCVMHPRHSGDNLDLDELSELSTEMRDHNRIVRVKKKVKNKDYERDENLMEERC